MSAWIERILQEFPADLSRFWIAADPDDLLLDEHLLSSLRERGFEVLPFDDSVAFRTEYEERYRAAWDRGDAAPSNALILHLRGTEVDGLPWDYLRDGRRVSLSLATLFPRLSYGAMRQIGSEHHKALFDAQARHAPQPLGETATKDFILTHIFRISPYLITRPEDLWRELLRLHYRGDGLPSILANHVASVLQGNEAFAGLPVPNLWSSRSVMVRLVQDAWDRFVTEKGVHVLRSPVSGQPAVEGGFTIPFEHPDVRVIVDSMFLDGTLHPLSVEGPPTSALPEWAKVGIVEDPNALERLVTDSVTRIAGDLPDVNAGHRDWTQLSRRLGELLSRFHNLTSAPAEVVNDQVRKLQKDADESLRCWVTEHYMDLPSLPAAKGPVMVHHVPRFLALRRGNGETRIALVVFDGMAMDQWIQIREHLSQKAPAFAFEESACFAWLPTLTSVSRQALFSGLRPREFSDSIETTAHEPVLWSRFWQDHGLRPHEVAYAKALKRKDQLTALEATIADPAVKVVGIVVDTIDEIVHGAVLGKRGVAGQIASWSESGFTEALFGLLLDQGFHVYLTADHGNTDAVGIGRVNQGSASELRGERVRTYRSETLAASTPDGVDAFRLDIAGLPSDFLPLFAGTRGAFVHRGEQIVAHGGLSVEEVIVPFVKVGRVTGSA